MKMISPNGVIVDAHYSSIDKKLANGWKIFERAVEKKAEPMPLTKPTNKGGK
jgi:flagellar biosynthesis/type III secretory pathway protein FliH